jgi:hypothetical protein
MCPVWVVIVSRDMNGLGWRGIKQDLLTVAKTARVFMRLKISLPIAGQKMASAYSKRNTGLLQIQTEQVVSWERRFECLKVIRKAW